MTNSNELRTSLPRFLCWLTLPPSAGAVAGTVQTGAAGMLVRVIMIAGRGLEERGRRFTADIGICRGLGVPLRLGVLLPEGDG